MRKAGSPAQGDSDGVPLGYTNSPLHDMRTRPPDEPQARSSVTLGPLAPTPSRSSVDSTQSRRKNSLGRSRLSAATASTREAAHRVDHVALPIVVTIPRAELEQLTIGSRALFVVEVTGFGVTSTVKWPFEKFEELHSAVARVTRFALPPLPQTQWFGNNKQDVIEDRRGRLEGLLQKMLMLQEVVDDSDELLWRFLQLPKPAVVAARFLCCAPSSRRQWLQRLWETSAEAKGGHLPLQHPLVEKALVQLARYAVQSVSGRDGEGASVAEEDERVARIVAEEAAGAFFQASIACELLARIFGRTGGTGRPQSLGIEPERHEWIEVLLMCAQLEQPPDSPSAPSSADASKTESSEIAARPRPLRETAMKALRTLARSNREAWIKTLGDFLDIGGLSSLASTAASDQTADATAGATPGSSARRPLQRLVTELILRGFARSVVQKIAASEAKTVRRGLLNTLFLSGDTFVRIMVGLLLAGLLCEEGFEDARQADVGLQDILGDLQQKVDELAQDIDICLLLLEPDMWAYLCALVSAPSSRVNSFALLVVAHVVQPSPCSPSPDTILENGGMHDTLLALCSPEADPESRYYASKILLSAYRPGNRAPPPQPTLSYLCSCLAINFQAKLDHDVGTRDLLGVEVNRACTWAEATSSGEELMQQARNDAAELQAEVASWKMTLEQSEETTKLTMACQEKVHETLAEHSFNLSLAAEAIGDGNPSPQEARVWEELRDAEALLSERECALNDSELTVQAIAEERMAYTKSLAEQDEAAWQLEASISEAEESAVQAASMGTPPGLEIFVSECRARYTETQENIANMRAFTDLLDNRLSEMCEPLPKWQGSVDRDRAIVEELKATDAALRQSGTAIDTWAGLYDRQRDCSEDIENVRRRLRDVRGCVASERERRRGLRASISQLMGSLASLDDHLASLESWDGLEDETGEGAWA